ncbi:MAG: 2'-5' RNA ligase family protein [Patescibacteria group bacterium]|nr:2'-5' RNA ligase family protein [Patescibacteria group bacterium]
MQPEKQHAGRDYGIPDRSIGFWATGISDLDKEAVAKLRTLLAPISEYCLPVFQHLPHVTCRYLGYHDEVPYRRVSQLIPKLQEIYRRYLPLSFTIEGVFRSWERSDDWRKKLIMARVVSPQLPEIHLRILEITDGFGKFTAIEGENFSPHISLAYLKEDFKNCPPRAVNDFIEHLHFSPIACRARAAYVRAEDGTAMKKIV